MSDLSITRGDDVTVDVAVSADAIPVDLTTATGIAFTAKRSTRDADADALIRKDLDDGITADEDGAHVTITAEDTRDLAAPVALPWDLEVIDEDGLTHTVASGILRINPDVTREQTAAGSGSGS